MAGPAPLTRPAPTASPVSAPPVSAAPNFRLSPVFRHPGLSPSRPGSGGPGRLPDPDPGLGPTRVRVRQSAQSSAAFRAMSVRNCAPSSRIRATAA